MSLQTFTRRMKLYERCVRHQGWTGAKCLFKSFFTRRPVKAKVNDASLGGDVVMRIPSSDVMVFRQIVRNNAYDLPYNFEPKVIVDLGSNVGYSIRYFANRFPDSRIIGVEADPENMPFLEENVANVNAHVYHRAAWSDCDSNLRFAKKAGDFWGGSAVDMNGDPDRDFGDQIVTDVQSISIEQIMKEQSLESIDILKVDIEGAERELFQSSSPWIDKVRCAIVELHEYNAEGATKAVMDALTPTKKHKTFGENEVFWEPGIMTES